MGKWNHNLHTLYKIPGMGRAKINILVEKYGIRDLSCVIRPRGTLDWKEDPKLKSIAAKVINYFTCERCGSVDHTSTLYSNGNTKWQTICLPCVEAALRVTLYEGSICHT